MNNIDYEQMSKDLGNIGFELESIPDEPAKDGTE